MGGGSVSVLKGVGVGACVAPHLLKKIKRGGGGTFELARYTLYGREAFSEKTPFFKVVLATPDPSHLLK